MSRVIAVADAFVALATDRPYRRAAGRDVALDHINEQRGAQFDSRAVDALFAVLHRVPGRAGTGRAAGTTGERPPSPKPSRPRPAGAALSNARSPLYDALNGFDEIGVFAPACDKARAALASKEATGGGDLVAAIEGDTGLTVAVLRRAQQLFGERGARNVADAVAKLDVTEIEDVMAGVTPIAFPWTTYEHALLYEVRVHSQTVARAVDRMAQELGLPDRDDLITAALLHDVGKLVFARLDGGRAAGADPRTATPEERVRDERRMVKLDHCSIGGLLVERWGLPRSLSATIAAHHGADPPVDAATLLRLADMVARDAHADRVDRRIMLRLAQECGLPVSALRDTLFDLPQPGSQRRRAQPSPLSRRETDALRQLAAGKRYKEIAADLGVTASTVRTHFHSIYAKMAVDDRAQAVLRATEMGWI